MLIPLSSSKAYIATLELPKQVFYFLMLAISMRLYHFLLASSLAIWAGPVAANPVPLDQLDNRAEPSSTVGYSDILASGKYGHGPQVTRPSPTTSSQYKRDDHFDTFEK